MMVSTKSAFDDLAKPADGSIMFYRRAAACISGYASRFGARNTGPAHPQTSGFDDSLGRSLLRLLSLVTPPLFSVLICSM